MRIKKLLNSWLFIILYLSILLVFPISILINRAGNEFFNSFVERATDEVALSAYFVTFSMAFLACILNTIFGFLIAWVLVRYKFPGKRFLDIAIDLPFALPTSVAGFTLVSIYSDKGVIGSYLSKLNIQIIFTRFGIVIAMIFVSFPFIIRTLQPALETLEREYEQAAWVLGASSWKTFYSVVLPILLPSFLTGFTLSFSRAIGEYGSIVIISSNFPLKDLIASVFIFQCLEQYDYTGATIIGTVMLFISLILLVIINFFQRWSQQI
uniref:Sulfate transport system permease protein CysT n=1 Tax=Ostreobium sp. HV05007bc TaxID=1940403 RepID=A0A1X9ZI46_9CHLO|nr:sulfate ABC transporter permease subunit CysT [Ostreobium sp. HV05007bc]UXE31069.1 Sulfate ABC transporter permease subunit CysT [Ostreobium quekettii]